MGSAAAVGGGPTDTDEAGTARVQDDKPAEVKTEVDSADPVIAAVTPPCAAGDVSTEYDTATLTIAAESARRDGDCTPVMVQLVAEVARSTVAQKMGDSYVPNVEVVYPLSASVA